MKYSVITKWNNLIGNQDYPIPQDLIEHLSRLEIPQDATVPELILLEEKSCNSKLKHLERWARTIDFLANLKQKTYHGEVVAVSLLSCINDFIVSDSASEVKKERALSLLFHYHSHLIHQGDKDQIPPLNPKLWETKTMLVMRYLWGAFILYPKSLHGLEFVPSTILQDQVSNYMNEPYPAFGSLIGSALATEQISQLTTRILKAVIRVSQPSGSHGGLMPQTPPFEYRRENMSSSSEGPEKEIRQFSREALHPLKRARVELSDFHQEDDERFSDPRKRVGKSPQSDGEGEEEGQEFTPTAFFDSHAFENQLLHDPKWYFETPLKRKAVDHVLSQGNQ